MRRATWSSKKGRTLTARQAFRLHRKVYRHVARGWLRPTDAAFILTSIRQDVPSHELSILNDMVNEAFRSHR